MFHLLASVTHVERYLLPAFHSPLRYAFRLMGWVTHGPPNLAERSVHVVYPFIFLSLALHLPFHHERSEVMRDEKPNEERWKGE